MHEEEEETTDIEIRAPADQVHRLFASYLAIGYSDKKARERCGIKPAEGKKIQEGIVFQTYLRAKRVLHLREAEKAAIKDAGLARVKDSVIRAVDRLDDIIDSHDPEEANKAAKTILEYGVGKTTDKGGVAAVQVVINSEKGEHLARIAKDIDV